MTSPADTPTASTPTSEITLTNTARVAVVDEQDAKWLQLEGRSWRLSSAGYVLDSRNKLLHRVVYERVIGSRLAIGWEVHHRDRDRLNCTRANLVKADGSTNRVARSMRRGSSGRIHVYERNGLYRVQVKWRDLPYDGGTYKHIEAASLAADLLALGVQGIYAALNDTSLPRRLGSGGASLHGVFQQVLTVKCEPGHDRRRNHERQKLLELFAGLDSVIPTIERAEDERRKQEKSDREARRMWEERSQRLDRVYAAAGGDFGYQADLRKRDAAFQTDSRAVDDATEGSETLCESET